MPDPVAPELLQTEDPTPSIPNPVLGAFSQKSGFQGLAALSLTSGRLSFRTRGHDRRPTTQGRRPRATDHKGSARPWECQPRTHPRAAALYLFILVSYSVLCRHSSALSSVTRPWRALEQRA